MKRTQGRDDDLRVTDMLAAVKKIQRWASEDRAKDDLYVAGVLRELGVIGEAAGGPGWSAGVGRRPGR